MLHEIVHPDPPPDDLHPAVDALIERLRAHYPDMSGLTAISMTGRGRDFLHHLVHTRIGGLLPTILSFDDYRTRCIAEATGRMALMYLPWDWVAWHNELLIREAPAQCHNRNLKM